MTLEIVPVLHSLLVVSPANVRSQDMVSSSEEWRDFVEDVREHGIESPLEVAPLDDGRYEIIKGSRRFRAWEAANYSEADEDGESSIPDKELPCIVVPKAEEVDYIVASARENAQRLDLTPQEWAPIIKRLEKLHLKDREIAKRLNKSPSWVSRVKQGKAWNEHRVTKTKAETEVHTSFPDISCPACLHVLGVSLQDGEISLEDKGLPEDLQTEVEKDRTAEKKRRSRK